MPTKKKPATKTPRTKRPPRLVWLCMPEVDGLALATAHSTKTAAEEVCISGERVVGPYALVERVRER